MTLTSLNFLNGLPVEIINDHYMLTAVAVLLHPHCTELSLSRFTNCNAWKETKLVAIRVPCLNHGYFCLVKVAANVWNIFLWFFLSICIFEMFKGWLMKMMILVSKIYNIYTFLRIYSLKGPSFEITINL